MWTKRTVVHCWWDYKLLQPLRKHSTVIPEKIKNRAAI